MAKSPISVNLYCPTLAMGMGNESFFGKAASQCWSKVEGPTPSKKMYGISSVKNTGFKFLYQWKIRAWQKLKCHVIFYDALFKTTQPSIDFYVVISTLAKYVFVF